MSLSNVLVVAILVNDDDDVSWRDIIGGSISRFFVGAFVLDNKSSLFDRIKSSTGRCLAEDEL